MFENIKTNRIFDTLVEMSHEFNKRFGNISQVFSYKTSNGETIYTFTLFSFSVKLRLIEIVETEKSISINALNKEGEMEFQSSVITYGEVIKRLKFHDNQKLLDYIEYHLKNNYIIT